MIIAKKGDLKKKFTSVAWNNLGENKNGWVEVSGSIVENTATNKKTPPPSGTSETKTAATAQKVENLAKAEAPSPAESKADDAFIALAKEKLTRNQIKDYFDLKEVPYKQNDNLDTLIQSLSVLFNNNVEQLKIEFSL